MIDNNKFLIYTKKSCPHCDKAKGIFQERGIPYQELVIGHDITREEVLARFPWVKVAPIILHRRSELEIQIISVDKLDGYLADEEHNA